MIDPIRIRLLIHDPAKGKPDLSGFINPVCIPATMIIRYRTNEKQQDREAINPNFAQLSGHGLRRDLHRALAPTPTAFEDRRPTSTRDFRTGPLLAQNETCAEFIAAYCKASILRAFPGQYLNVPVEDVLEAAKQGDAAARTAKKLLIDNRFRK